MTLEHRGLVSWDEEWVDVAVDHNKGIRRWTSPKPGIQEEILLEHFGDFNETDDKFLLYYEVVDATSGRVMEEEEEFLGGVGGGGGGGNETALVCDVAVIVTNGTESCPILAPRVKTSKIA